MLKKLQCLGICLLLFTGTLHTILAENKTDQTYHVVNVKADGEIENIKDYDTYAEAKVSHTLWKVKYHNLGITRGDDFITIEQGIVAFQQSQKCDINTNYTTDETNEDGYTNACYGADAAFLEHNVTDQKVKFMLSGVIGWVDADQVDIYPIEKVKKSTSYALVDDYLVHHIQTDIEADAYASSVTLAKAPTYLKEDTLYYSYDGHYFYESFKTMIQDYRSNTRTHATNSKEPFYNYYQYISHRTSSIYDEAELSSYFKDTLAINATIQSFYDKDNYIHDILTQSMIPDAIPSFLQYQNTYGANALLMLSLSMNETALGKSYLAYTRNNLFGHAAFDSAVEENASRYQSVDASIYAHAFHYITSSYANPEAFQYHGSFLGDKSAGMNVQYASDPYWGEKAAQYAFRIDEALGNKDTNRYSLAITNGKQVSVYPDASAEGNPLYTIAKGTTFSFVVLEKTANKDGSWYLVQSDPALTNDKKQQTDGSYSFITSYGYIKADVIETILNKDQMDVKNYIPITFDANGGTFYPDKKSVTLQVEQGILPSVSTPVKDHALFDGWDKEINKVNEKTTYKAQYKDVKEITVSQKPKTQYPLHDTLDAKDGVIEVTFADGSHTNVTLLPEMISGYSADKEGDQVLTISYAGCTTTYSINISKAQQEKQESLSSQAQELLKHDSDKSDLNEEALQQLAAFKNDLAQAGLNALSSTQIRALDALFQKHDALSYSVVIKDKNHDLQVSGLSLALQNDSSLLNKLFPKTIVLNVKNGIDQTEQALAQKSADANQMRLDDTFTISGKDDLGGLQLNNELIYSIKKPTDHTNRQYKLYYVQGSDVYEIPTTQTKNRIIFTSEKLGTYVLVSKVNTSLQEGNDGNEVNTIATNGMNYVNTFFVLPCAMLVLLLVLWIGLRITMKKKRLTFKFRKKRSKLDS